jgi:hypothetical protein
MVTLEEIKNYFDNYNENNNDDSTNLITTKMVEKPDEKYLKLYRYDDFFEEKLLFAMVKESLGVTVLNFSIPFDILPDPTSAENNGSKKSIFESLSLEETIQMILMNMKQGFLFYSFYMEDNIKLVDEMITKNVSMKN